LAAFGCGVDTPGFTVPRVPVPAAQPAGVVGAAGCVGAAGVVFETEGVPVTGRGPVGPDTLGMAPPYAVRVGEIHMVKIGIIDTAALLDSSKVGAEAAKALEKAWTEAKAQPDDKKRELLAQLEQKRAALRQQLIDRARPLIAELAKKKTLDVVLEKGAIVWSTGEDLTKDVIAKVDAGGPLKA
jgi:Skp family chaperone for outer membrane proteins